MIKEFATKIDYPVPESLRGLVVGIILGQTPNEVRETLPMYATGYSILFNIFGDKPYLSINGQKHPTRCRLIVAGQICNANIKLHIDGLFGQLGVVLYPTATYYLFHKTGDNFLNTWSTLRESSPIETGLLMQQFAAIRSMEDRILILINFLKLLEKQRLAPICWLDKSLEKIFSRNGNVSQNELVKDAFVTARHYRRTFKRVIGISPKYYCKIIQLATVFELLKHSEEEKLHHLALDCGYYDQSHFIHDFQKLIGRTPENFLGGKHSYLKTYMGRRGVDN